MNGIVESNDLYDSHLGGIAVLVYTMCANSVEAWLIELHGWLSSMLWKFSRCFADPNIFSAKTTDTWNVMVHVLHLFILRAMSNAAEM